MRYGLESDKVLQLNAICNEKKITFGLSFIFSSTMISRSGLLLGTWMFLWYERKK
jgi:hypothetical protein